MGARYAIARQQVADCCAGGLDDRPFRAAVLEAIRPAVPYDGYVWLLTDPVTAVGASPLAHVPAFDMRRLPQLILAKYMTSINRWTALDCCATLADTTAGRLSDSHLWSIASEDVAAVDILQTVLRDRYGYWGFLDLWRYDGLPFDEDELEFARSLVPSITQGQRERVAQMFRSFPGDDTAIPPALVLFDDELNAVGETAAAEHTFRRLLPTDPSAFPVRAAAFNVAAQLLASEAGVDDSPPTSRVHLGGGAWLTCTAARLQASPSLPASIAVTIDPIAPADRVDVFSRASGLTARETDVLFELSRGNSTRHIARELGLSEYTVQEHLKAIFTKSDTASRAELVARACGSAKS